MNFNTMNENKNCFALSFFERRLAKKETLQTTAETEKNTPTTPKEKIEEIDKQKKELEAKTKKAKEDLMKEVEAQKSNEKNINKALSDTEVKAAIGLEEPRKKALGDLDWINKIPLKEIKNEKGEKVENKDYKEFAKDFLEPSKKILENLFKHKPDKKEEFKKAFDEIKTSMNISVDEEAFYAKFAEFIAIYAKTKRKWNTYNVQEEVKDSAEGRFSAMGNSANDLLECLLPISKKLKRTINFLKSQNVGEALGAKSNVNVAELLGKLNPEFVKDGKLQPAIINYLLAGNNIIDDLKKVMIVEKWTAFEPKINNLADNFQLGISNKKEFLKQLAKKSPEELAKFAQQTEGLLGLSESLKGELKTGDSSSLSILNKIFPKIIENGKINLLALAEADLTESTAKIQKLKEIQERIFEKAEALIPAINSQLGKFGGKLPSSLAAIFTRGNLDSNLLEKALEGDSASIEKAIFENVKKEMKKTFKIEIKASKLDDVWDEIKEKLAAKIEKMAETFNEFVISLLKDGFTIKNKNSSFELKPMKEKDIDIGKINKLRGKIIPVISEFLAEFLKEEDYENILNQDGTLNLEAMTKVMEHSKIKQILKLFENNKTSDGKPDMQKIKEELAQNKDHPANELGEKFGEFAFGEGEKTKAMSEFYKAVTDILPEETKLKALLKELREAWKAKGSIWEKIMGVFGVISKHFESIWGWIKGKWDKVVSFGADLVAKTPKMLRDKVLGIAPDALKGPILLAVSVRESLSTGNYGFLKEEISELKKTDFTMGELMGDHNKDDDLTYFEELVAGKELKIDPEKLQWLAQTIRAKNGKAAYNQNDEKISIWDFLKDKFGSNSNYLGTMANGEEETTPKAPTETKK